MDDQKFMLISMHDPKMKNIADVLANKTCKKIIDHLADNEEASQKDLSDALDIPMNTMEYNIKKLLDSGLIQKRKNFFWSKKGKKIIMYELSNRSIVISPKRSTTEKIKSLIPAFMITGVLTFASFVYQKLMLPVKDIVSQKTADTFIEEAPDILYSSGIQERIGEVSNGASSLTTSIISSPQPTPVWIWFMAGGLIAIFVLSVINWRRL